ncbi:MAG: M23 family metallopeptidase [Dehalococcoidia bacterium]|nr:MAG: M23 family metallopeptidase [Dehalococcoidia bacterium]
MLLAAAAAVVLGVICTTSSEDVYTDISIVPLEVTPTAAPTSPTPTPTPEPTAPPILEAVIHGFQYPIAGACLPTREDLMPNAPRDYRWGVHEGIDFYDGDCCVPIERGMPVLAAKTGVVIRADHDYQDITAEEMDAILARTQQQGYTDAASLDRLRGQQVWLDHGDGIVTRYAHLLDVEVGIEEGMVVEAGQVVGYVGNSGTPEGVTDSDLENHLHFEIRVGAGYLGEGLSAVQTRRLCEKAFAP